MKPTKIFAAERHTLMACAAFLAASLTFMPVSVLAYDVKSTSAVNVDKSGVILRNFDPTTYGPNVTPKIGTDELRPLQAARSTTSRAAARETSSSPIRPTMSLLSVVSAPPAQLLARSSMVIQRSSGSSMASSTSSSTSRPSRFGIRIQPGHWPRPMRTGP